MSMMTTNQKTTDAVTGLPVFTGSIMTMLTGTIMVTQPTGESPRGYNTRPGTDPSVPASIAGPGVPRGFESYAPQVPSTGNLIVNGRIIAQ